VPADVEGAAALPHLFPAGAPGWLGLGLKLGSKALRVTVRVSLPGFKVRARVRVRLPAGARAVLGQIPIFLGQGGGSGEAGRRLPWLRLRPLEAIRVEFGAVLLGLGLGSGLGTGLGSGSG